MSYDVRSFLSTPARQDKAYPIDDVDACDAFWTAARCDNLIATLNTRIELLKLDGAQYLPASTTTKHEEGSLTKSPYILKLKRRNRTTYANRARREKDELNGDGPAQWTTGAPARAPGEAWDATLFLRSAERDDGVDQSESGLTATAIVDTDVEDQWTRSNGNLRSPALQPGPSRYQVKQLLKQARATIPIYQYDMSLRVCEAYQALNRATKNDRGSISSKSLVSMCLRAMPARMKLEQEYDDLQSRAAGMKLVTAARNISSEMYSEICKMDLSGQGGRHVQVILQAHGTEILGNAIKDGVLCPEFGLYAVMNCIQISCKNEAEVLMEAITFKIRESAPTSFSSQPSSTFALLLSCATSTATYFRMLTKILLNGGLPISWLATKHFQRMWQRLYTTLAGDAHCQDAEEFYKQAQSRISYSSKLNHSPAAFKIQSLLDFVPSSDDGSTTEPESSTSPERTPFSDTDTPSSPRKDHGFRAPPQRFRKSDSSISQRLGHACLEGPSTQVGIGNGIGLRTPFPPSFGDTKSRTSFDGSLHDMDSSGDELGY